MRPATSFISLVFAPALFMPYFYFSIPICSFFYLDKTTTNYNILAGIPKENFLKNIKEQYKSLKTIKHEKELSYYVKC